MASLLALLRPSDSQGYEYLSASDMGTLPAAIARFVRPDNPTPVFLEVFTNMKTDGENCLQIYRKPGKQMEQILGHQD